MVSTDNKVLQVQGVRVRPSARHVGRGNAATDSWANRHRSEAELDMKHESARITRGEGSAARRGRRVLDPLGSFTRTK